MAKGREVRENLDVLTLARTAPSPPTWDGLLVDYLKGLDPRYSPPRALLEQTSDWEFVDALATEVAGYGLDRAAAEAVVAAVLGSPSLAIVARSRPGHEKEVLMAVALDPAPSDGVTLAIATLVVNSSVKPPSVKDYSIELASEDLTTPLGISRLAARLETHQRRLGVPKVSTRPLGEIRSLVWMGNPLHLGYFDTPSGWIEIVRSTGIVHGIDIKVVQSPEELKSKDLIGGSDRVLSIAGLDIYRWGRGIDADSVVQVGRPGAGFERLIDDLRTGLIDLRDAAAASVSWTRELSPGEQVFHRKIGRSGPFDTFDEGSDSGCVHSSANYVRFHKAPKAEKGLQRRYSNLEPGGVFHCGQYPNCGVYMVKGPR